MRTRKAHAAILGIICFGVPGFLIGCLSLALVPYGIPLHSAVLFAILMSAAAAAFGAIVGLLVWSDWSRDPPDDPLPDHRIRKG